jgi:uncharacterized protein
MTDPHRFLSATLPRRRTILATIAFAIFIVLLVKFVKVHVPFVRDILFHEGLPVAPWREAVGTLIALVCSFAPAIFALLLWRKHVESAPILTLFSASPQFRWRLALVSAAFTGGLGICVAFFFDPDMTRAIGERARRFSAQDWSLLASSYAIGVGLQATFEEVFFRGWLSQHVNRFMPNTAVTIFTTSCLFCAMHWGNPGLATYPVAFVFGLAFGYSAYRLNGLEAAIGAHTANNVVFALLGGAMLTGNRATFTQADIVLYAIYLGGFLLFVEIWARFFDEPSRA